MAETAAATAHPATRMATHSTTHAAPHAATHSAQDAGLLASVRKIAVLRALNLGDMLCAIPALRALRAAAPQADITLVGLPWAAILPRRFPQYIDRFQTFPGFPGMPERRAELAAIPPFLAAMQVARFDLAIQLHGSGEASNIVLALMGAARTAGHRRGGMRDGRAAAEASAAPGGMAFAACAWRDWQDGEHEVLRYLRLLQAFGVPAAGAALEFPVTAADLRQLQRSAGRLESAQEIAVIHPGASLPSRRWPATHFAAIGDALAAAGLSVVLTGSAEEAALCRQVGAAMRAPALDLAGATELGTLAALLRTARLLVCNDTGVVHLARALGTPSVAVCCGADPYRFAPLDADARPYVSAGAGLHRVLAAAVDCRPCMQVECPVGHACAIGVTVDAVLDAVQGLLPAQAVAGLPSP